MKNFVQDFRHMFWLFKSMVITGLKGDWESSREAWLLIKLHWNYVSTRIR